MSGYHTWPQMSVHPMAYSHEGSKLQGTDVQQPEVWNLLWLSDTIEVLGLDVATWYTK